MPGTNRLIPCESSSGVVPCAPPVLRWGRRSPATVPVIGQRHRAAAYGASLLLDETGRPLHPAGVMSKARAERSLVVMTQTQQAGPRPPMISSEPSRPGLVTFAAVMMFVIAGFFTIVAINEWTGTIWLYDSE